MAEFTVTATMGDLTALGVGPAEQGSVEVRLRWPHYGEPIVDTDSFTAVIEDGGTSFVLEAGRVYRIVPRGFRGLPAWTVLMPAQAIALSELLLNHSVDPDDEPTSLPSKSAAESAFEAQGYAADASASADAASASADDARDEALLAEGFAEDAAGSLATLNAQKGAVNGVGSLDGAGKQPESQVPTRLSEASLSATIDEVVDDAIDGLDVSGEVASAIAADGTVAAAAAVAAGTAVDVKVAVLSLVEQEVSDENAWNFAVLHPQNREVLVGQRTDGTFYPDELNPGQADEIVSDLADDQGWRFAFVADNDEVLFGQRTDGTFYPDQIGGGEVETGVATVIHGDSLTAGWSGTSATALAGMLGHPVSAIGDGGHRSFWIAARQGGQPLLVSVAGDTIPASGAVACTIAYAPIVGASNDGMPASTLSGVLAGIPVALAITSEGVGTVTRISPGRATVCPAGSRFVTGAAYRERWPILWAGRNNFKLSGDGTQIVNDLRRMLAWNAQPDHALILSIPPWAGEENGTGVRNTLNAVNATIAAEWPTKYEDTAARLRSVELLAAIGITATSTDLADIAAGLTPTSLRSDAGHLNADGYRALNILIAEIYTARGWI